MIGAMAQTTEERPSQTRPGGGRGVMFWAGVALLAAGLVVLGYVAWQFFGTTVVSQREQQRIVEQTRRAWTERTPAAKLRGAEALVRVPRFGRDYVVPVQKGVSTEVLAKGFGHFRGTAAPGQVGNYALAGHRVTHGEPLRRMPELRPGDKVVVETRNRVHTYRLDTDPNDLVVTFNDIWVIDEVPQNPRGGVEPAQRPGQRLLTLTTCSELFHTDNRMIAFGHLVGTRRR